MKKKLLIILFFICISGRISAQDEIRTDSLSKYSFFLTSGVLIDTPLSKQTTKELTAISVFGTGYIQIPRVNDFDSSLIKWVKKNYNHALVRPVSSTEFFFNSVKVKMIYSWIFDNIDTLNILLVRKGIVPAGTMLQFDDETEGKNRFLKPDLNKAIIQNHISTEEYNDFKNKIKNAEKYAYDNKLGIWSDEKTRKVYSPYKDNLLSEYLFNNEIPITEFKISGSFFYRKSLIEMRTHSLLGNVLLELFNDTKRNEKEFIIEWINKHPDAVAKTVSPQLTSEYLWIYNNIDTLNIDLVRNGIYPKLIMLTFNETYNYYFNDSTLNETSKSMGITPDSAKNSLKFLIENMHYLVSDEEYEIFKQKLEAAENYAKENKLGIWKKEDEEKNE